MDLELGLIDNAVRDIEAQVRPVEAHAAVACDPRLPPPAMAVLECDLSAVPGV